jgi:hypothetical protein
MVENFWLLHQNISRRQFSLLSPESSVSTIYLNNIWCDAGNGDVAAFMARARARVCVFIPSNLLQMQHFMSADLTEAPTCEKNLNEFIILTFIHKFLLIILVNTNDCITSPSHNILRHRNMHHSTFVSKILSDLYYKTEICSYFHATPHTR